MLRKLNTAWILLVTATFICTSVYLFSFKAYALPSEATPLWNGTLGSQIGLAASNREAPKVICVSTNEAIVVWQEFNGVDWDIYADKVDLTTRTSPWFGKVAVCTAIRDQINPEIADDGAGGALIAWQDKRATGLPDEDDIYVQRLNGADGASLWTLDGVAARVVLNTDSLSQQIICASTGEAIVTWQDNRSDPTGDIYAQKFTAAGAIAPGWTANGEPICNAPHYQKFPQLCSDGSGGAIITWHDNRASTETDIYAYGIKSNGDKATGWQTNGNPVCVLTGFQLFPQIVSDGSGGAVICWEDEFIGNGDIYSQKMSGSGSPQWAMNGIPVCSDPDHQTDPQMTSDGFGGAVIIWQDYRNINVSIYAQKVASTGIVEESWTPNGALIVEDSCTSTTPRIAGDGFGGAIITWEDTREAATGKDIFAQKIFSDGTTPWTIGGVCLCNAAGNQLVPAIANDYMGGAVVVWEDHRAAPVSIYGNRIWGPFSPHIFRETISVDGIPVNLAQYLSRRPAIFASIRDDYLSLGTTSVEVQFGTQVFTAIATADSPNTVFINFVPDADIASGVTSMYIRAKNNYDRYDLYKRGTFLVPGEVALVGSARNVPNPFKPLHGEGTVIQYKLNADAEIKLLIYDITGRSIWQRNYMPGQNGGTVVNNILWNGKNEFGEYVGNGAYVYIITSGAKVIGKGHLAVID